MALAITSPDITSLDYTALFDISGAVPTITLTNASVVINPDELTWWYVITTPSNTPIHEGSAADPDVVEVAWTTLQIASGSWPQPFGTGACAQIEFSCNAPYTVTVYVKDSENNTYSLTKTVTICRPYGNTSDSCGNFGVASVVVKTECNNARLVCSDTTPYAYQNKLTADTKTNTWTLVYPQSPSGSQPTNGTASNTPSAVFPISFSGTGFNLYVRDYGTYNMGDGMSVKLQYKAQKLFNVYCNVDLCQLQCEMDRFYAEATSSCGELEMPGVTQKMTRVNFLYNKALTGVLQPLCNIDVPAVIVQIEALFGFKSTCCCGTGVNMSNDIPSPSSGACCTTAVQILDIATGEQPANCPQPYFPVQVYNALATALIGVANDVDELVAILNQDDTWTSYGVAINAGNCNVGFILDDTTVTVPAVYVRTPSAACVDNEQIYNLTISDVCISGRLATTTDFPLNVYVDFALGDGPQVVSADDISALIVGLNSLPGKPDSVAFTNATTPSTDTSMIIRVRVTNNSCSDYSETILMTCDVGSSSFLVYGASHTNYAGTPAAANGAVIGYGMKINDIVGEVAGLSTSDTYWHTIKIDNTLIVSVANTGKILFYDITNPLSPVFIRFIQLTTIDANNFTGLPASKGIDGGYVKSYYGLYFPTDFHTMTLDKIFVFESLTGSAWQIDMYDSGSGVTDSFVSPLLKGCCPRVMASNLIFFTLDGTLYSDIGAPTPVATGYIAAMDVAPFDSSSVFSIEIIALAADQVWAATYDGVDSIYFMGKNGTLNRFLLSTAAVDAAATNTLGAGGSLGLRGNIKFYQNALYVSSLEVISSGKSGAVIVDLGSYPSSTTQTWIEAGSSLSLSNLTAHVHNICPLGNCLMLLTNEGYENSYFSDENGAIALFKTDGTFLSYCDLGTGQNIYNVVPISGVPIYTPTTLIP